MSKVREWLWWRITLPILSLRMQIESRNDLNGDNIHV